MDKFRVFVYMLMRDASLKQRIPCIMRILIFGAFSAGKKCALYTGKYGMGVFYRFGLGVRALRYEPDVKSRQVHNHIRSRC